MTPQIISLVVLLAMFVIATVRPVNIGILAFPAAFLVGTFAAGLTPEEILEGFPANLFVLLVGVTYLFALAQNNGTIAWLTDRGVGLVGGRLAAMPWVFHYIAFVITAVGALPTATVAILAPIVMGLAARYSINALLMGLMLVHGAHAGSMSPISPLGAIVNGTVESAGLPNVSVNVFLNAFFFNELVAIVVFVIFGGIKLLRRGRVTAIEGGAAHGPAATPGSPAPAAGGSNEPGAEQWQGQAGTQGAHGEGAPSGRAGKLTPYQGATLLGIVSLVVLVLAFKIEVGFAAFTVALILLLMAPVMQQEAVNKVSWSVVLLITGIITYIGVLNKMGTIDLVGETIAGVQDPQLASLAVAFIGGLTSAFALTAGIVAATIPLALPALQASAVDVDGTISAVAIASSVVDTSPLSVLGALLLANLQNMDRDKFFRALLLWGFGMVVVGSVVPWLLFVVIGLP